VADALDALMGEDAGKIDKVFVEKAACLVVVKVTCVMAFLDHQL